MKHELRIKEARNSIGMSQMEIAAVLGISQSFYSDLENGKSEMSLNMYLDIVDALNSCPSLLVVTRCCQNCKLPSRKYPRYLNAKNQISKE